MTKRLTKAAGILLFLLFVGGTVLLPAIHRAYCADNHVTHDATHCPICQLSNTPTITASSAIALIAESIVCDNVVLQVSAIPTASFHDATQARAPPVC